MKRVRHLTGLILIAVLSFGPSATGVNASSSSDDCWPLAGCQVCNSDSGECIFLMCPIGDPRGIVVICT